MERQRKAHGTGKRVISGMMALALLMTLGQPAAAVEGTQPNPFPVIASDGIPETAAGGQLAEAHYEPAPEHLVPQALTASLESLVSAKLITPKFLKKQAAIDGLPPAPDTFSTQIQALMMASSAQSLFEDTNGLASIHEALLEKGTAEALLQTPSDVETLAFVKHNVDALVAEADMLPAAQFALAADISLYIDGLLPRKQFEVNPNPNATLQSLWTESGQVVLRWQPEGEWVPALGYHLYRVTGKKAELIAQHLGAPQQTSAALNDYVQDRVTRISRDTASGLRSAEAEAYGLRLSFQDLLTRAVVKPEELKTLGHPDEASLNRVLYPESNRISNLQIVRGVTLFQELRQNAFSRPEAATYDSDALVKSVVLSGAEVNRLVSQASLSEEVASTRTASEKEAGARDTTASRSLPLMVAPIRRDRLTDLQNARGMIKAQANFDLAFAETTGLAYVDDLRVAGISTEEEVSYVLLPVYDKRTQGYDLQTLAQRIHVYNRENGIVTDPFHEPDKAYDPKADAALVVAVPQLGETQPLPAPETLTGFAVNNTASLRWELPAGAAQGIVSGYHVYRRLDEEKTFVQINESPVTVPYVTAEAEGIRSTFEGPVFFTDVTVKNGQRVHYKVQSLDIFGRTSAMSEATLDLDIVKTTLPNPPVVDAPYLSSLVDKTQAEAWLQHAIGRIKAPTVILPISAAAIDGVSVDEVALFHIYRSVAVGRNAFGKPEKLATVNGVDKISHTVIESTTDRITRQTVTRTSVLPGTYYADTAVEAGKTYQYWVSAEDVWGNESAWSLPVSLVFESDTAPPAARNATSAIVTNIRPDLEKYLPGFGADRVLTSEREEELSQLVAGSLDYAALGEGVSLSVPDASRGGAIIPTFLQGPAFVEAQMDLFSGLSIQGAQLDPDRFLLNLDGVLLTKQNAQAVKAIRDGSVYGQSVTQATVLDTARLPEKITEAYGNLPDPAQVHHLVAYKPEDIKPDGSLPVSWYHYQGDNLKCYAVYRGVVGRTSLDTLNRMEKAEVIVSIRNAELVVPAEALLTNNVFVDRPPAPGRDSLYVYIIVMIPESSEKLAGYNDLSDTDTDHAVGAWVQLSWDAPLDASLVDCYRVYRTEADSSEDLIETAYPGLSYELIQDRVRYDTWTDQVPQSVSHDLVYRIVPVSLWGVEGPPVFTSVHVPATIPPAEPEMLVPHSRPGAVEVRFTEVSGATSYQIYRTEVPQVDKEELYGLQGDAGILGVNLGRIAQVLVPDRVFFNTFLTDLLTDGIGSPGVGTPDGGPLDGVAQVPDYMQNYGLAATGQLQPFESYLVSSGATQVTQAAALSDAFTRLEGNSAVVSQALTRGAGDEAYDTGALLRFVTPMGADTVIQELAQMQQEDKASLMQAIIETYGILAVAEYSSLSPALASTVPWDLIDTLQAQAARTDADGIVYVDESAEFGKEYLYTVSASNGDLTSSRAEPMQASCLKGTPFPEAPNARVVSGYTNMLNQNVWVNQVSWDHVTSEIYTEEELLDKWIAGYLVFRSNRAEGPYHQVSSLLRDTTFSDVSASPHQHAWYRIKTVDTAGFISEFEGAPASGARTTHNLLTIDTLAQAAGAAPLSAAATVAAQPGFQFSDTLLAQAQRLGYTPTPQALLGTEGVTVRGAGAIMTYLDAHYTGDNSELPPYVLLQYMQQKNITSLQIGAYTVTGIDRSQLGYNPDLTDSFGLYGSGWLTMGETGVKVPVHFVLHNINPYPPYPNAPVPYEIADADIQLAMTPYVEPDTGLRLAKVDLEIVSQTTVQGSGLPGQAQQVTEIRNLSSVGGSYTFNNRFAGDVDALYFSDATLDGQGLLTTRTVPVFHHGDFVFYNMDRAVVNLDAINASANASLLATGRNGRVFPITFHDGFAENAAGYATLDNKGMAFSFTTLGLIPGSPDTPFCPNHRASQIRAIEDAVTAQNADTSGILGGLYGTLTGVPGSHAQLVVPVGLTLKLTKSAVMLSGNGVVANASYLTGDVVLPFFEAPAEFVTGLTGDRISKADDADINALVLSVYAGDDMTQEESVLLDKVVLNLFDEVIGDGLLVMDGNTYGLSKVGFAKGDWDGKGFLLQNRNLKPTMVGNYDIRQAVVALQTDLSNPDTPEDAYTVDLLTELVEQSFVVTSPQMILDLDNRRGWAGLPQTHWYARSDWVGLLLQTGTVAISRDIITARAEEGKTARAITFTLEPMEMVYDRNGFYYYNKLDMPPGEEIPTSFGEDFGRFREATLSSCEVEMVANRFNLSLTGTVAIPALGGNVVGYRMYTDRDDGLVKAAILPAAFTLSDVAYRPDNSKYYPVSVSVGGGYLDRRGAHLNGSFDFVFPAALEAEDIRFNEWVIPSSEAELMVRRDMLGAGESLKKGTALFEKPFKTSFNGFTVALRAMDMYCDFTGTDPKAPFVMGLYLRGSAAMADNLELPKDNNAQLYLRDINGSTRLGLEECLIHVDLPVGTDGLMSGTVRAFGDDQRADAKLAAAKGPVSGAVGDDSAVYSWMSYAQQQANGAVDLIGDAQAIQQKIDGMIADINSGLDTLETLDAYLEGEIKAVMQSALTQYNQQRSIGRNLILVNARGQVDAGNTQIGMLNSRINEFNAFYKEHTSPKDEDVVMEVPNVPYIDKGWILAQVEEYTAEVDSWVEAPADFIASYVDDFSLDLFGDFLAFTDYRIPYTSDDLYVTDILEAGNEYATEVADRLNEVMTYYDEANGYIDQLDEYFTGAAYPGFTIGADGIVEFKPTDDLFCMTLLKETDFLEGTDVQVDGRMGWKMNSDLFFYAFTVGYIPAPDPETGKVGGIKLGAMELQNLVGMTGYNFNLPYQQGVGYTLGTGTALMSSMGSLQIDLENKGEVFFAASADMFLLSSIEKHTCAVKDLLLVVESTGSFQISGSLYGPAELTKLSKPGPDNSTTLYGSARATYNAQYKEFEFRAMLRDLPVSPDFRIGGGLGLDWNRDAWMLYLGYPDTMKITYVPLDLTGGFGLQLGVNALTGNPVIKVKLDLSCSTHLDAGIVYADASMYAMVLVGYGPWNMEAGEDEFLWFNNGNAFEGFGAGGELSGMIAGGLRIPGVGTYEIIRLSVDSHLYLVNPREDYTYLKDEAGHYYFVRTMTADGRPVGDKGIWHLDAKLRISYHLSLLFASFADTFDYHFQTTIKMS